MIRSLVIGFGNIDRADDGVAIHVVNSLRKKLGQEPLVAGDTGLEELGRKIDSVFIPQLLPEIMEIVLDYNRLIFVDAHAGADIDDVNCRLLTPDYVSSTFTHHMVPASLLAFLKALYNREPESYLVSIRGYNFDFSGDLTPQTKSLIQPAAEKIMQLLKEEIFYDNS